VKNLKVQLVRPPLAVRAASGCAKRAFAFDILLGCLGMRVNGAGSFVFHVSIFLRMISKNL
jgi:uncharacterized membrane protein YqaE (UPF0057 family)